MAMERWEFLKKWGPSSKVCRGLRKGLSGAAPLRDYIGGYIEKNPDGCRKKCSSEGAVEAENGI